MQLVSWASDNTHILLNYGYRGKTEYILLDRTDPAASINLSANLALPAVSEEVRLDDSRYDHYLALNTATRLLSRVSLSTPVLQPYVSNVLTYDAIGGTSVLYATPDTADTSKVAIELFDGTKSYLIRRAPAKTTYLLALSSYQGDLYAAVSASSENAAFVYENPVSQLTNAQLGVAVPVRVLNIKAPDYVTFSTGGQYVVFEHGSDFAAYDAESEQRFQYTMHDALDTSQLHASWVDGARLQYISGNQLQVFDYDGQNHQTLVTADARYLPAYDASYKTLYTFMPAVSDKSHELLTTTPLRIAADQ